MDMCGYDFGSAGSDFAKLPVRICKSHFVRISCVVESDVNGGSATPDMQFVCVAAAATVAVAG